MKSTYGILIGILLSIFLFSCKEHKEFRAIKKRNEEPLDIALIDSLNIIDMSFTRDQVFEYEKRLESEEITYAPTQTDKLKNIESDIVFFKRKQKIYPFIEHIIEYTFVKVPDSMLTRGAEERISSQLHYFTMSDYHFHDSRIIHLDCDYDTYIQRLIDIRDGLAKKYIGAYNPEPYSFSGLNIDENLISKRVVYTPRIILWWLLPDREREMLTPVYVIPSASELIRKSCSSHFDLNNRTLRYYCEPSLAISVDDLDYSKMGAKGKGIRLNWYDIGVQFTILKSEAFYDSLEAK